MGNDDPLSWYKVGAQFIFTEDVDKQSRRVVKQLICGWLALYDDCAQSNWLYYYALDVTHKPLRVLDQHVLDQTGAVSF